MMILTRHDPETIASCLERDEYFWLDLVAPEPKTLRALGAQLDWNPLLTEDLEHGNQRPKIEDFADHAIVVCYAAVHADDTHDITLIEHGLVVHGSYLVTVRPAEGERFAHLRAALATNQEDVTEATVVHRVLDLIVDTKMDAADVIASDVDQLERTIDHETGDEVRDALRSLRRDLVNLRGVVVAQRDALYSLATSLEAIPGFQGGMRSHFRDVTDHAHRVVDRLEISRHLLDAAVQAYNTNLIARQGAVSQRLTVIATIFLPLTFVTGFFGQNFNWMVDQIDTMRDFLIYGVGTTVATALLLGIIFRRLKWW